VTTASVEIAPDDARRFLVDHLGVARFPSTRGHAGARGVLEALGAVQLDPLDPIGTNADLVMLARVRGMKRGEVHDALFPGHAFEHFAKERCLLPARAFPYYRDRMIETPWWRSGERAKRVDRRTLAAVLDEVRERGPMTANELSDHGRVEPIDWSGWRGTSRAAKMALEILWTRCDVVVCGRRGRDKLYDVPSRALPMHHDRPRDEAYEPWALIERVTSAGLLAESSGPAWSMLKDVRKSRLVEDMIEARRIERTVIAGKRATYLAPAGFRSRRPSRIDDAMRILGPLDPLLWDRALVHDAFGFEYLWEVYKPAHLRRWGWYVCPLLHRGELVGRIEARIEAATLIVDRIWREENLTLDEDALDACLERHAAACGADRVKRPRKTLRSRARARRRAV
jgi:uncharacterized protein YcaQ